MPVLPADSSSMHDEWLGVFPHSAGFFIAANTNASRFELASSTRQAEQLTPRAIAP